MGLTNEFSALESLSLINVGLTSLKGFPKLSSLKKVDMSQNTCSMYLNYHKNNIHMNIKCNLAKIMLIIIFIVQINFLSQVYILFVLRSWS